MLRSLISAKTFAFVILIVLLFSLGTPAASATTKKKAAEPLQAETVNIYCRLKTGNKTISSSGSGVFIHNSGVILTNAHVAQYFLLLDADTSVKGECDVRTGSPAKANYTASVLYIPTTWMKENATKIAKNTTSGTGEHDFALLYVTGAEKGSLPLTFPAITLDKNTLPQGAPISVSGYPSENLSFKQIQQKLAQASASSTITGLRAFKQGAAQDVITIAPSSVGKFGVSGGPVLNEKSALIGIVATKSSAKDGTTLRAISTSYIDTSIRSELGLSLEGLLSSNFASRAGITQKTVPEDFIDALETSLRKKK